MVSQQRSVTDIDVYCKAAERLASMIPSGCCMDHHGDGCHGDEKLLPSGFHLDDWCVFQMKKNVVFIGLNFGTDFDIFLFFGRILI